MNLTDLTFVQDFIGLAADASEKEWHERNGGNLSYRIRTEEMDFTRLRFAPELKETGEWTRIGVSVPELAAECFLVTGSGKFMQHVGESPEENLAIVQIDTRGENYCVLWGLEKGGRPTSEFPTHLMNHAVKKRTTDGLHRVIYHAHPVDTIALTFVLPLNNRTFTRELWSMITECPIIFPEGIGVLPWMMPGGREIAEATSDLMKTFNVVVWAHHGVFCSGATFDEAFGLMDTIEKAAEIAVKVRSMGGKKNDITMKNLKDLAKEFDVTLNPDMLD
ncbi:MAG TPA: rhamnulose-1-phosphate aldolase [Planctomycetaceae bacterium]|nr:rhamnulose-1-phosphate aldolase [Planctomycetaceae bacterium]